MKLRPNLVVVILVDFLTTDITILKIQTSHKYYNSIVPVDCYEGEALGFDMLYPACWVQ
jgi:hypothetical protein